MDHIKFQNIENKNEKDNTESDSETKRTIAENRDLAHIYKVIRQIYGEKMGKYIIETDRIGLREITENDFETWHRMLSDQETMQYYPQPFDAEKTESWIAWNQDNYIKYGLGLWAVI